MSTTLRNSADHHDCLRHLLKPYMRRQLITFLLCVLMGGASLAAQTTLPPSVAAALQRAKIPESAVSIYVQDVLQSSPVLALNAERSMNPASTIKLLTTYAALDALGPAFRWKTEVFTQGSLKNTHLNGDLIFKGYGDPKLTLEAFWQMLRDLRQRGLKDIRGNLVLDRSFFDIPAEDPRAFDNEPYKPYNVAPDALLLNYRAHRVRFFSQSASAKPSVIFDPSLPNTQPFTNEIKLTKTVCGDWKEKIRFQIGTTINIHGQYADTCGDKSLYLSILDNNTYFGALFSQLWEQLGGSWKGKVVEANVPDTATFLASFESPQLTEVIRDINKFSNNVMARNLFLTLGASIRGAPANTKTSADAVNDWLATRGQRFLELSLDNGSGLSRSERISAHHMAWLLRAAYHSSLFSEFESSLPIVAVDGTMRKRLNVGAISGQAHIKSGSLNEVRTIAGYIYDAQGRRMLIVCFINHANADLGRAAQDALMEWVYTRKASDEAPL